MHRAFVFIMEVSVDNDEQMMSAHGREELLSDVERVFGNYGYQAVEAKSTIVERVPQPEFAGIKGYQEV